VKFSGAGGARVVPARTALVAWHRSVGSQGEDPTQEEARRVAQAITPVPGGVGPMTITMLLYNTVQAARQWAPI